MSEDEVETSEDEVETSERGCCGDTASEDERDERG